MAQYRGGLLSVTFNSNIINGIGTLWVGNVEPGDMLLINGDTNIYTVDTVESDTRLTIVGAYQASSKSGVNYAITRDFTPARGYPVPVSGDIEAIRIFAQALKMIDADMGSGGGGGGGAIYLDDLLDVSAINVPVGDVLSKLSDGTFGFQSVQAVNIGGANLGTAGTANGAELYAGTSGGNLTFRRLKFQNLTFTQTATDITITGTSSGEVNTGANAGSAGSLSIYKDKLGTVLRFFGLRAGAGITILPEGDDLVFSSSGTGGGAGEANTSSNLGTGNVLLAAPKTGVNLPFKSINFPTDRFTVTEFSNTFTVAFKPQPLSVAPDVSIGAASVGQVLRKGSDGLWSGFTLPASGIASVSADTAPTLGGDLNTAGRKILGITDTFSGFMERPKAKSYTLVLSTTKPINLSSMVTRCALGTVSYRIDVGGYPASTPQGRPPGAISGTATTTTATATPSSAVLVAAGSELTLTLESVSASSADFAFSLTYVTA